MHDPTDNFLRLTAEYLYKTHGQGLADLTIVFPNHRTGVFFKAYLHKVIDTPLFAPEIITIQELFANICSLQTEDQLLMVFQLYKLYKELSNTNESFDEFYLWGEMLLNDFDQVDKYLVDAQLLFTNITNLKEIDRLFSQLDSERREEIHRFWESISPDKSEKEPREFTRLWQILFQLYTRFREALMLENCAYEGMLFREAVENKACLQSSYLLDRKFIVAGFNALNGCEKKLFSQLLLTGNIEFFWDYDAYYLNERSQEAGLFMRENLELFPQKNFPYNTSNLLSDKHINLFHTPSNLGQAQLAAVFVNKLGQELNDFDQTAIVLCDEELLLPVMSSLPKGIEDVNVTMGLPLKQTPLFSLISQLIALQQKNKSDENEVLFHYKPVVEIIGNQLVTALFPNEAKSLQESIVKRNLLYVSEVELHGNELFVLIFKQSKTVDQLPGYFMSIVHQLFLLWESRDIPGIGGTYQEYLYQIYLILNKLNKIVFSKGSSMFGSLDFITRETFFKLLLQYLATQRLNFEGEPLSGLQVMGILETRCLDFRNIMILSVNEGIMPKANSSGSFIPYNLRRGVGLPTVEEQQAMYAYYFYRLLQRAENCVIVYNSSNSLQKSGEKSRFLHQLQLESHFTITETGVENAIDPIASPPIVVAKQGIVGEKLRKYTEAGRRISPTALDQYLHCPLSFYFKQIAGLEEDDEVTEDIDARVFGTIFHAVIENLYSPFIAQNVTREMLQKLLQDPNKIESQLYIAFNDHFFKANIEDSGTLLSGKNILVFEVIRKMIVKTIEKDISKTPFYIAGLENKVRSEVVIWNGTGKISIGGVIDRIDKIAENVYEIIDYKTGNTSLEFASLDDLFDKTFAKRNKAAFQTLIYAMVWNKMNPETHELYPSIYSLRKIFSEEKSRLTMKGSGETGVNYLDLHEEFLPRLTQLLEEIFDPEKPFEQTSVVENCQYCSFSSICGKPNQSS